MSNLFFKSESVKNSVKSGLNSVSKQVFKAFLLMSMMLLSWNGWGQGYTIIYPEEGINAVEKGKQVTIVFNGVANDEFSKYLFLKDNEPSKEETKTGFLYTNWPDDFTEDYNKVTSNIDGEGNRVTITIPTDVNSGVFYLYYGIKEKEEFWFFIHSRKISYKALGVIPIYIKTNGFSLVSNLTCFCPGSEYVFEVRENFYEKLKWTYSEGEIIEEFPADCIEEIVKGEQYVLKIPETIKKDVTVKCEGLVDGDAQSASLNIPICKPMIIDKPQCVKSGNTLRFDVVNACPTIGYSIGGVSLSGKSFYAVEISNVVWRRNENTKTFELKDENGNIIESFSVIQCDIDLECTNTTIGDVELSKDECSLSLSDAGKQMDIHFVNDGKRDDGDLQITYTYKLNNEEVYKSELYQTLEAGNEYTIRANVVVDNANIGYCESNKFRVFETVKPEILVNVEDSVDLGCNPSKIETPNFEATDNCDVDILNKLKVEEGAIKEDGCKRSQTWTATATDTCGNAADAVSVTYTWIEDNLPPAIEIEDQFLTVNADVNGPCVFVVPDLTEIVKEKSSDKCTAQEDLLVTQTPAAGEEITQTSDVIVEVRDKCNKTSSVTIKVIVPDVLILEELSQKEIMTCSDGKPHATISSDVRGGVAPYTITVTKDETPLSEKSQELQTAGNFSIADLEVGEYNVTVTDLNGCEVTKEVSVTFTPQELTITGKNIEKIYNGQPQSAEVLSDTLYSVEGLIDGDVLSLTFNSSTHTDVDTVDYTIDGVKIMRGDKEVTCFYSITATGAKFMVSPRKVTLTSATDTKVYDGTALTNDKVTVSGDGFVAGEATATAIGSQTEVGSSKNTIKVEEGINFKLSNYDITPVEGELKVTPDIVTVQIKGNKQTFTYNGSEQKVSGYEVVSITSSSLGDKTTFTKDMVEFVPTEGCDGSAVRTDVGKTFMNLTSENFKSTNGNFVVTFNVTDGYVDIEQLVISVEITGNSLKVPYDKNEHEVSGYQWSANSNLYTIEDFEFVGDSALAETNVGVYPMGLESGEFTNLDGNFKVTFSVVEDGSLTILAPSKVQVTITEHGSVETYNNEEYVVKGYDFATSNDLYTLSDFKFLGDSVVSGTNVGNYPMGLKAEDFENLNKNFEVEFNVVHNSLVINPLDVLVEITGNSLKVPYDKNEHEVSGYQWSANSNLYTIEDFEFVGDSALAETNVGVYPMGLESGEFTNLDGNFKVTFSVVEDGSLTILAPSKVQVTITEHGSVETYNNEEYVVEGYDFATSNDLYTLSDFKFLGDSVVSGTNVGNYPMGLKAEDFENLNKNFEVEFNVVHNSLVINPLDVLVEITGNSLKVPYDKNEHEVSGYQWSANSNLYTIEDFEFVGDSALAETNVGVYPMGLESGEFTNLDGNFKVTFSVVEDGSLTILAPSKVQVTITEHGAVKTYNNEEYVVKGYDFATSNDLYTLSDFKFHGDSVVSGTNVGSYPMDLKAEDFENINENFEVEFNVVHNSLVINPLDVLVEITGNRLEVPYDKNEHEVSGYKWSSNSDLYTVEDFEFGGDSALAETNVGVYPMGLESGEFTNLDNNFKVTFNVVEDGSLTILGYDKVQVTITEHGSVKTYNNEEYVVKGYDFATSNDLYTLSDFKFHGDSVISGTNVGSYPMDLKAEDFENINENFEVEFNVVHNSLVINPLDVLVEITGNRLEVPYDKNEHEVSGYKWSSNSDLYTVEDFEFGGDSALAETNVGVYPMGLESGEFTNLDNNFKVTFNVVEDGSLTILGYDKVQVTITEHGAVKTYNNEEYVVKGYDFATSNDLYTLSDFKFLGDSVVSGTNVGNYPMGLKAEDFENLNKNFEVEFKIVNDSLVINPLDVLVEITGNSLKVPYDKNEHEVSGYQWSANSNLYTIEDFEFVGDSSLAETNVGVYPMGLESGEFTNLDGNFKVTFNVVEDGTLTILGYDKVQVTITEHGAVKTYNNEKYVVTGYDFATSNDLYTLSDFKFLGDSVVSGTNVGNYPMGLKAEDFENINENFEVEFNIVHNSLVINPLDVLVEITGNSSTEVYNGNQHTLSGYTWRANSNLYTEEDFEFVGDSVATGTIVGKYAMGLLAGEFININKNFNVNFSVVEDGELIISQLDVIVTIAGATKETHYTGSSQSISGYTWSSNTSTYTESDFTFSGNSLAYGINVGTYPMNLSADQFTNINKNFGKVTFVIEDGGITITPMVDEVVVRIAGHHEEVLYDGKEHTLTGYSLFTNHNLLTQDDIEFSGEEMAKAVNAGTYHLGLSVDQFKNTNKNFANVKFEVSDGTLIINKRHVLLESESKTQVYNGELFTHKVVNELKDGFAEGEGATYEFYAELLYAGEETNEFSYTLNEGTLAENYIIEEKYGTLTLAPVRKAIDIIANSAEKYHDRKPLSDPGYTYTEGVLIEGDTLIVEIEGVITEVGVTKNEIVSYRVMRGDIDVTDNYTFGTIKNGSLRVLHANHPTVVFVRDGKIIVHEAFEFVYVYDVLSRRVYLDGKAGVFIEEYGELDVPCTGAYVVIIGEESYKVVVHKK